VTSYPKASGSQLKSNLKTNRISPAKGSNKLLVEDLPRTNRSHLRTTNRVDSSSRLKRTGIQKALTKEVKQMKDVFEELEAKVAQCAVDRKHDAIELKNLLIANDNLIAKCLSQEVFCVATNTELNVARFTDMHVANTTAETRVDCCPIASRSQPMSHVKPNRISPAKGDNKLPVDDQPRKIKVNLRTSNHIDSSSHLKRT
nr:hypothetical protein [Tanacetum cinerariifolium]